MLALTALKRYFWTNKRVYIMNNPNQQLFYDSPPPHFLLHQCYVCDLPFQLLIFCSVIPPRSLYHVLFPMLVIPSAVSLAENIYQQLRSMQFRYCILSPQYSFMFSDLCFHVCRGWVVKSTAYDIVCFYGTHIVWNNGFITASHSNNTKNYITYSDTVLAQTFFS
jgi:hypothetical protein